MGIKCAAFITGLFLLFYARDLMVSSSYNKEAESIQAFTIYNFNGKRFQPHIHSFNQHFITV